MARRPVKRAVTCGRAFFGIECGDPAAVQFPGFQIGKRRGGMMALCRICAQDLSARTRRRRPGDPYRVAFVDRAHRKAGR